MNQDRKDEVKRQATSESHSRYDNLTGLGHFEKRLMKDSFIEGAEWYAQYLYSIKEPTPKEQEILNNPILKQYKRGF